MDATKPCAGIWICFPNARAFESSLEEFAGTLTAKPVCPRGGVLRGLGCSSCLAMTRAFTFTDYITSITEARGAEA